MRPDSSLTKKTVTAQYIPSLMVPGSSLSPSQKLATAPYPHPDKPSPLPYNLISYIHFNIILSLQVPQVDLYFLPGP